MSIVKSISVGDGDMFYIDHNSDNFSVIDCFMHEDNRESIVEELKTKSSSKVITRFISTHPDEDHIQGMEYLNENWGINNFYCVENKATKLDPSSDFKFYCKMRNGDKHFYVSKGCTRKWMNVSDEERGCAGINFIWPVTDNPDYKEALELAADGTAYNNISPIFTYSVNDGVKIMWMGDMEHDFLEKIKGKVNWPEIDILFAPHHGRESGKVSSDVLEKINPYLIVIGEAPSKYLNYYSGYNTITQNSAGDITFKCSGNRVHVYVSKDRYSYDTSFLTNEGALDSSLGKYLGTFETKEG